jgi:hypothetical protein
MLFIMQVRTTHQLSTETLPGAQFLLPEAPEFSEAEGDDAALEEALEHDSIMLQAGRSLVRVPMGGIFFN